jgi:hypothetical protein
MEGVDTLRLNTLHYTSFIGQHPVCFGASAIGNQFHGGKSTHFKLKNSILL